MQSVAENASDVQDLQQAGLDNLLESRATVPQWARERLKAMYRGLVIMTTMANDADVAWKLVSALLAFTARCSACKTVSGYGATLNPEISPPRTGCFYKQQHVLQQRQHCCKLNQTELTKR